MKPDDFLYTAVLIEENQRVLMNEWTSGQVFLIARTTRPGWRDEFVILDEGIDDGVFFILTENAGVDVRFV